MLPQGSRYWQLHSIVTSLIWLQSIAERAFTITHHLSVTGQTFCQRMLVIQGQVQIFLKNTNLVLILGFKFSDFWSGPMWDYTAEYKFLSWKSLATKAAISLALTRARPISDLFSCSHEACKFCLNTIHEYTIQTRQLTLLKVFFANCILEPQSCNCILKYETDNEWTKTPSNVDQAL